MDSQTNPPSQHARLPDDFRPLFWSYRFEDLDPQRDEKTVVINLINYGNLGQWRWLVRQYGATEIRQVLESAPASETRPRTRELAGLLFSISIWRHAHRSAH